MPTGVVFGTFVAGSVLWHKFYGRFQCQCMHIPSSKRNSCRLWQSSDTVARDSSGNKAKRFRNWLEPPPAFCRYTLWAVQPPKGPAIYAAIVLLRPNTRRITPVMDSCLLDGPDTAGVTSSLDFSPLWRLQYGMGDVAIGLLPCFGGPYPAEVTACRIEKEEWRLARLP